MHSIEEFDVLVHQEKIDYLTPLFLELPESFVQSKVMFSYLRRGNPSNDFLHSAYLQILQYIEDGKLHITSVNSIQVKKNIDYVKKFEQLESSSKEDAELFLTESLSTL